MAVQKHKRADDSRVFELLNLNRLKNSEETISRAQEAVRRVRTQIERTRQILNENSANKRYPS